MTAIGRGGVKNLAFFFEDIAGPGNGANRLFIRPLLRMTSTKPVFSSKLVIHTFYCTCRMRRTFPRPNIYAFSGGYRVFLCVPDANEVTLFYFCSFFILIWESIIFLFLCFTSR